MKYQIALVVFAASALGTPQFPSSNGTVPGVFPSTVTAISSGLPSNSANSSMHTSSFRVSSPTLRATTTSTLASSGSKTSSSGGSGAGSSSAQTSPTSNAGSAPTAAMGMGLAGVVGLLGALAL